MSSIKFMSEKQPFDTKEQLKPITKPNHNITLAINPTLTLTTVMSFLSLTLTRKYLNNKPLLMNMLFLKFYISGQDVQHLFNLMKQLVCITEKCLNIFQNFHEPT